MRFPEAAYLLAEGIGDMDEVNALVLSDEGTAEGLDADLLAKVFARAEFDDILS